MKNILIVGASRGLGDALSIGLPDKKDKVWLVSRSEPVSLKHSDGVKRYWIKADLASEQVEEGVSKSIRDMSIDLLIYNAGIWEQNDFEKESIENLRQIIMVNLISAVAIIHKLLSNLKQAKHAKIVFIGSTSGLENEGCNAVAYAASKFGIRGLAHSLREYLREDGIAVSCINPGSMATDVGFTEGIDAAIKRHKGKRIPVQDIVSLIKAVVDLSPVSCVKELHVPALGDTDV